MTLLLLSLPFYPMGSHAPGPWRYALQQVLPIDGRPPMCSMVASAITEWR